MISQGLKRLMVARGATVQLLIGSTNRAVCAGLINQNVAGFSLYNAEMVSKMNEINFFKERLLHQEEG